MAKPPEPLQELLPSAVLVVHAAVKEVVATGPAIAAPDKPAEWTDKGTQSPSQQLVLEVSRVLKGALADKTVTVTKPVAGYAVKVGTAGAWLVDASNTVLGRYGPDTWALAKVEEACKR